MEYELYHYGRKGMKWYQRIFSRDKEKAAARKAAKEAESEEKRKARIESTKKKVRASRSAEELYKHASLFDDKELQAAYQRLLTEKQIKDLIPAKVKKGKKFVDSVGTNVKSLDTAIKNTVGLYDTVKGIFGRFSKSDDSINSGSHEKATKNREERTSKTKEPIIDIIDNRPKYSSNQSYSKPKDIIDVTPDTTALARRMVRGAAKNTINFTRNNQGRLETGALRLESGANFVNGFLALPAPKDD